MQFKKLLGIALVVVMLISCMLFVACNGDDTQPTEAPTSAPTQAPTDAPTEAPTQEPTEAPTAEPTEAPTADPNEGKVEYKVVVKDSEGNPVSGVRVVVCKDETCFNPVVTDANGVAVFMLDESNGYKGKVSKADGYDFADEYTYFENGATQIEITITAICEHVEETVAGKAATCTEAGLTDGVVCSVCGATLTAQETIPATGIHTEVVVTEGAAATCKYDGLTDEVACSVCGVTLSTQEVIPATGHTPGAEPTCTDGQKCTVCNTQLVPKNGHSYADIYATACSVCGEERTVPTLTGNVYKGFSIGSTDATYANPGTSFIGATLGNVNATTGSVVIDDLYVGIRLSFTGCSGFDTVISKFGYYFDDDTSNVVESAAGRVTDSADKQVVGNKGKVFDISVNTTSLSVGEHKVTFVAIFGSGICVDVAEWTINIIDRAADPSKPTANVIIIAGQSNAQGCTPITDGVKAMYNGKTFENVYIHYNNIGPVGDVWQTVSGNDNFEAFRFGIGGVPDTYFGPELGIIDYLTANGYTDDAPLYVIKIAAGGTYLNGQWFPTEFTGIKDALDPYGLVADMGDYLYDQMIEFVYESFVMIPEEYNIAIQSFFWIQGESDSVLLDVAKAYGQYEQMLVNSLRTDLSRYASDSGISFVNYAIQESPEDGNTWGNPEITNNHKKQNCGYWYDPKELNETSGEIIVNENPSLENSYLVIGDIMRTKVVAGDIEYGAPSTDWAHLCGEDMVLLGKLMGAGMLYLKDVNNAE